MFFLLCVSSGDEFPWHVEGSVLNMTCSWKVFQVHYILYIDMPYVLCIHQEASTRMSVTSLLVKNWKLKCLISGWLRVYVCVCSVAQLCPTLCNPTDCSPPGSCVHGIFPGKNTRVGCHFLLQMDAIAMCYIAMAMRMNTLLWRALHGCISWTKCWAKMKNQRKVLTVWYSLNVKLKQQAN